MSNNNNTTLVWGCIGRSCALCKKDHKACNGARPCSRCIGMGWEAECRDVALKPRGRPRKTRSKGPAATTSTNNKDNGTSSGASEEGDQPLSVSPSLFVTSFPFLSTNNPGLKGDISEKVSKLTQRLGGSHVPAVSSGLRSDAASPKVSRKRRAVGPSSACEAASNKRREVSSCCSVEDEEFDEEEEEEEEVSDCQNNHNNHNHHNNIDEKDCFEIDQDEPDVEEGLIPYEMVFRVNLVSSCSSSSKKSDNNNNSNKKVSSQQQKKRTSSTCSHNNNHNHNNNIAPTTNNNNNGNKSPSKQQIAGFERKVLRQIEEEVDFGLSRLDNNNNNNNTHNTFASVASASASMEIAQQQQHQLCLGSEEEMIDSFSCAEQYVQQYWQQHNTLNNTNNDTQNNNMAVESMLLSPYFDTQKQQHQSLSFFLDSMSITSTANASFMFLKTEPMALAQEEKLGRNPYFIRTPPQLRRCVSTQSVAPTAGVDCMEDEEAWF